MRNIRHAQRAMRSVAMALALMHSSKMSRVTLSHLKVSPSAKEALSLRADPRCTSHDLVRMGTALLLLADGWAPCEESAALLREMELRFPSTKEVLKAAALAGGQK